MTFLTNFSKAAIGLSIAVSASLVTSTAFAADTPSNAANADAALIARGAYLAHAGDCMACHTAKNGQAFAGGLPLATPMGKIYSTNITPDPNTGIGRWSYDDFAKLMRTGATKEGYTVYPAMPYPSYSRTNDADMHALYAYFHDGVAAVDQPNRHNDIPWPLSMRWPLKIWAWLFAPTPSPFTPALSDAPSIAQGAYLVEGLGHCGSCHTARGVAFQEKALTNDDGSLYLAGGGAIDGWIVPSLRNEHGGGLADWSQKDIVQFLKTGKTAKTASFGAMNDVIVDSMQYMDDKDLNSIAMYLKSLAPHNTAAQPYAYDDRISKVLAVQEVPNAGAQIYLDRCAACHRSNGTGGGVAFPSLAGNPVLQTSNPTSAIHIVLAGGRQPATKTSPSAITMGPFASVLSDQQVADVVSFIQTAWGNQGGTATASDVRKVRATSQPVDADGPTLAAPQLHHAAPLNRASGAKAGVSGG